MKAVRVSGPGEVELTEVPDPSPGSDEALIEVQSAALCATDRKLTIRGSDPPRVPGHEFAGLLPDGTVVAVHPDIGCGRCEMCRAGFENRCPKRESIGLDRDGGFAEWTVAPIDHVVPLNDVAIEIAPLLEPLACCVHAARVLDIGHGDSAVVVGAGVMGVLVMWVLQVGGVRVAVCQRSPKRRALARDLGAEFVVCPEDDLTTVLGERPRHAVVTAPTTRAIAWALENVRVGGSIHIFAGVDGGAPIDANSVHYRHLRLVGSTGSTVADYRAGLEMVIRKEIDLAAVPRRVISLSEVPEALLAPPEPDVLKVTIDIARVSG